MNGKIFFSPRERDEFEQIYKYFPMARIKKDYNRAILDIGVELPWKDQLFILLKGNQTNDCYELITPEYKCIEGLKTLEDVIAVWNCLLADDVDISHEMTREKGRNE